MSQYFTPAEAKALVRLSEEQIFERFPPAYVLERPLPAMDRATGKRCNVPPGVYEIDVFPVPIYVEGHAVTLREMEWRDGVALVNEFIAYAPYSEEALDDRPDWMKACPPGALAPIESEGKDSPLAPLTDIVELESLDDDLTPGGSDDEGYRDDPDFGYDDNRLWPRGYVRTRRFILRGDPIEVSKDDVVYLRWSILSYLAKKGKNTPDILADPSNKDQERALSGKQDAGNKGGRPLGFFAEAVEYLYRALLEKGDVGTLQPGKVNDFAKVMQRSINEKNPVVSG